MLTIIIGAILGIIGLVAIFKYNNPFGLICILLTIFVILIGLAPISGYEEPVLQQEYELKIIYEPDTYIIQDGNDTVTCKHVIKNDHPEAVESYGKYTYHENVEVVVTEKGSTPVMKKYLIKAKKTIFAFPLDSDKTKYIFYVPEENIERWQNKHVY